ncbi:uncharacterized protein RDI95_004737 isoform 4-T15 [Morus bassanus]
MSDESHLGLCCCLPWNLLEKRMCVLCAHNNLQPGVCLSLQSQVGLGWKVTVLESSDKDGEYEQVADVAAYPEAGLRSSLMLLTQHHRLECKAWICQMYGRQADTEGRRGTERREKVP